MNVPETIGLMQKTLIAQKTVGTPVEAAWSLNDYLGNDGIAVIGPCLQDGRFAVYAHSNGKEIPSEWHGFPVVNTGK